MLQSISVLPRHLSPTTPIKSQKRESQLVHIYQPSDAASQVELCYRFDYVKISYAMGLIIRTLSLAKSLLKFKLNNN